VANTWSTDQVCQSSRLSIGSLTNLEGSGEQLIVAHSSLLTAQESWGDLRWRRKLAGDRKPDREGCVLAWFTGEVEAPAVQLGAPLDAKQATVPLTHEFVQ
jgi:hypothetical protein